MEACQNSEGGYGTLAQHFGIPAFSIVQNWVKIAERQGGKVLQRRRTKHYYTSQFKQNVINYYLNSGDSYLDVALQYGFPLGGLLQNWHQKFLREGIEGLSQKRKDDLRSMFKKKKQIQPKNSITPEQALERAELTFIKKLHALRMDVPEILLNEMPESSTNSEANSD